jgi:hypothetical protein
MTQSSVDIHGVTQSHPVNKQRTLNQYKVSPLPLIRINIKAIKCKSKYFTQQHFMNVNTPECNMNTYEYTIVCI